MSTRQLFRLGVALLVTLTGAAMAQTGQPSGMARITGTVVADGTSEPLAGADVRILESGASTFTTPDGFFEFDSLPPGTHTVVASRSGYVTSATGMRGPADRPRSIELAAGGSRHVEIRLVALGVITGRLVDDAGQPARGVRIRAIRRRAISSPYDRGGAEVSSDDEGRFAIRDLDPGRYFVIADKRTQRYVPRPARFSPLPPPPPSSDREGDPSAALTYYPGTSFPDQAGQVEVAAGREADASFALATPRLVRITGIVLDAQGMPASGYILTLTASKPPQPEMPPSIGITTTAAGHFELAEVPPGEYVIEATRPRADARGTGIAQLTLPTAVAERARTTVRVAGDDVTGVTLQLSPGFTVSGRLVDLSGKPVEVGGLSLSATLVDDQRHQLIAFTNADGTFQFDRLSGRYTIRVLQEARAPVALERVQAGGIDATDEGVDVALDTFVELVVAPAPRLAGVVTTRSGQRMSKAWVVIFSENPSDWTPQSLRHPRYAQTSAQGEFQIFGLPAGTYHAAVPDGLLSAESGSAVPYADDLAPLLSGATTFSLESGEEKLLVIGVE